LIPLIYSLLTPWAERGVLLLNACLTVRAHSANSHADKGWEKFTSEVLRAVSKSSRGVVFLAWGTPAQKRVDSIGVDKIKHHILKAVHPSPLSAARGYFDCKHFIKTNEWLRKHYGVEGEIDWDCLAAEKQGKALLRKDVIQNKYLNGDSGFAVQDLKESTIVLEKPIIEAGKVDTHIKEDAEFDDEELDKLLSSEA
jgi:uracil-DNA glycosylase